MEDPSVLQLLLCLLEVDGDRFAELESKSVEVDQSKVSLSPDSSYISIFSHKTCNFNANWIAMTVDIENNFTVSDLLQILLH
jgi:hypothetical protein